MSLAVADALWRLDAYIERPTPYRVKHGGAPETRSDDETRAPAATDQVRDARGQGGFRNSWESSLEASINGLTPTSPSSPLLRRQWLAQYISSARAIVLEVEQQQRQEQRQSEPEPTDSFLLTTTCSPSHEWSLAARATLQTYGHVVTSLIEETISFDEDIAYWDNIVASRYNAALFTINTAPIRLANWFMELMRNIRQKIVADGFGETRASVLKSLSSLSLHKFREGLLTTLRHPLLHAQLALRLLLSPFKTTRVEARRQRRELVGLRNANAGAVGILLQHGCRFDLEKTSGSLFREVSLISTALMKSILHNDRVYVSERDTVAANAETNVDIEGSILSSAKDAYDMPNTSCSHVLEDLQEILQTTLHQHHVSLDTQMSQNRYSRPNALTRLWFPLTTFLLSSGIITSLITRHQVTLLSFIHDAADTVVAFGRNWVMTPCSKLLGIIRHTDAAGSDIALVSKASLQSDRDSLERMVFDFVTDIYNGEVTGFEQLKTKVQEGDLTSVLKAYEKDLRRPLVGTFRGGLIRAFLIQLQKTKVDVEVAMTGIDALLRSQELVFGFIGVTPGILVSYAALLWLRRTVSGKKGLQRGEKRRQVMFTLRDIHRILTGSSTTGTSSRMTKDSDNDSLSSPKHGLLVCAVERLVRRSEMARFPSTVMHNFREDVVDLLDTSGGVARQEKVLQRIQWTYAKYIS